MTSFDYKAIKLNEPEEVKVKINDDENAFIVIDLNIFENNLDPEPFIDPETYDIKIETKPRDPRPGFIAPKNTAKPIRPRWALKTSIFRDWKVENNELTKKCFEMDW